MFDVKENFVDDFSKYLILLSNYTFRMSYQYIFVFLLIFLKFSFYNFQVSINYKTNFRKA